MDKTAHNISIPHGRYVVAVSGGVDSVVLLHMLAELTRIANTDDYEFIVGHFDHGIRDDSASDRAFVADLAKQYGLKFTHQREELGPDASEDLARTRRYGFLRAVAKQQTGQIITAHHADDSIETIAINIVRGTGWRGLAVLDSDIVRPLLGMTKQEIMEYAQAHQLTWRQDSTNASDAYLRNRIRKKLVGTLNADQQLQVRALRDTQVALKRDISKEVAAIVGDKQEYDRYLFTAVDDKSADELLRAICLASVGMTPTRPQRQRALLAIKTARAGAIHQIAKAVQLSIDRRTFRIQFDSTT